MLMYTLPKWDREWVIFVNSQYKLTLLTTLDYWSFWSLLNLIVAIPSVYQRSSRVLLVLSARIGSCESELPVCHVSQHSYSPAQLYSLICLWKLSHTLCCVYLVKSTTFKRKKTWVELDSLLTCEFEEGACVRHGILLCGHRTVIVGCKRFEPTQNHDWQSVNLIMIITSLYTWFLLFCEC